MKKILCVLLTMVVLFSFCGCLGGDEDVRGETNTVTQNQTQNPTDNQTQDTTTQATTQVTTQAPTTQATTQADSDFSMGQATGSTYTNKFLGISCTLPSGWVFYSDEEILALNNIASDYMDEEAVEQLKNATIIYDMYAVNQSTNCSINVNLEKVNALQLANVNIKQVLEAQIESIKVAYGNMGYTNVSVKYQKTKVCGVEFDSLKITAKLQDFDFHAVIFTFKKGTYLANVTACALNEAELNAILNNFTVVK